MLALSFNVAMSVLLLILIVLYVREKSQRKTHPMPGGIDNDRFIEHQQEWVLYHNEFSLCSKKTRMCLSEYGIAYESREVDLIETGHYQNIGREFLAVNPSGLVPVLVHNGRPIYESHEQLSYLTKHASNPLLLSVSDNDESGAESSAENRAKKSLMNEWVEKTSLIGDDPTKALDISAGNTIPGLTFPIFTAMIRNVSFIKICEGLLFHREKIRPVLFIALKVFGLRHFAKLPPIRIIMHNSQVALDKHLDQFETDLAKYTGSWLLGEQFSLADVGMVAILDRLREGDWLERYLTAQRPNLVRYWMHAQLRNSYQEAIEDHQHPLVVLATNDIIKAKECSDFTRSLLVSN